MAAFLDKTATAMEGGKSLAMVLPPRGDTHCTDIDAEAGLTFVEALAYEEEHAPLAPGGALDAQAVSSNSTHPAVGADSPAGAVTSASNAGNVLETRGSPTVGSTRMLDKRKRVVQELIDTERSHAVDMAVVRDIYLARARGARESRAILTTRRSRD